MSRERARATPGAEEMINAGRTLEADGGMAQGEEIPADETPRSDAARAEARPLPLETHDLTLTTSIDYRDGLIEYIVSLRNDGAKQIDEVTIVPSVSPEVFRAEPPGAQLGPLAAAQSASATFILEPIGDFESLVLARPVLEGRDADVRSTVKSRKGSITCEVDIASRQGFAVRGLEITPLLPEGFVPTVPSRRVDLGPRQRMKLTFNVLPKADLAVAERRARRAAFSPRGVDIDPPSAGDLERALPVELRPLPPYSRMRVSKPGLKLESKAIRGLMARSEVREVLRAEEVVPGDIEITVVKGVKAGIAKRPQRREEETEVEAESRAEAEPSMQRRPARVPRREEPAPAPVHDETEGFESMFADEIKRGKEIAAGTAEPVEEGAPEEQAGLAPEEPAEEPAADVEAAETEPTEVDPEHPPCPDCGNGLDWIDEYERWYCYSCEKYPW